MSEPANATMIERALKILRTINRVSDMRFRLIAVCLSFLMIVFPPWGIEIVKNGMAVRFNSGHSFLWSGSQLAEVDYKKLALYLALVWLAYLGIVLIRKEIIKGKSE